MGIDELYDTGDVMLNDKEFQKLLEKYDYNYKIGDVVSGFIVSIEKDLLNVDIGSKANAICPLREILLPENKNVDEIFKIGEKHDFIINSQENDDGAFYLSQKKVAIFKNIELLSEKQNNDEVVMGTITGISKGGALVNVMGIKGFVPASQLKNSDNEVGEEIELKILSIDTKENNYIFSNKKAYNDATEEIRKEILDKIELNMVIKGKVVRLTDFGAFVDIGGLDGLLPLSQMSWKWIDSPLDVLKCNDKIDVEIIGIEKDKQRVSLSLKTLQDNPWPKAQEYLKDKKEIVGRITRIKPFGIFVEVYPDVEGLLNKQQINQYNSEHDKKLSLNDELSVIVKKIDVDSQKINLEIV